MGKQAPTLVLLRHGQSEWNKQNLFTGWVDVPLSPEGIDEALQAGEAIRDIPFTALFMSRLVRAQMTAWLALSRHRTPLTPVRIATGEKSEWGRLPSTVDETSILPVYTAWELNERMYGDLQGMDKDEARRRFGVEQVHIWRRSYDVAPPQGESLKMTAQRVLPYWEKAIAPRLDAGEQVLVAAHGNSLRALIMMLEGLSEEEVVKLEIPTGKPLCYGYEKGTGRPKSLKAVQAEWRKNL